MGLGGGGVPRRPAGRRHRGGGPEAPAALLRDSRRRTRRGAEVEAGRPARVRQPLLRADHPGGGDPGDRQGRVRRVRAHVRRRSRSPDRLDGGARRQEGRPLLPEDLQSPGDPRGPDLPPRGRRQRGDIGERGPHRPSHRWRRGGTTVSRTRPGPAPRRPGSTTIGEEPVRQRQGSQGRRESLQAATRNSPAGPLRTGLGPADHGLPHLRGNPRPGRLRGRYGQQAILRGTARTPSPPVIPSTPGWPSIGSSRSSPIRGPSGGRCSVWMRGSGSSTPGSR